MLVEVAVEHRVVIKAPAQVAAGQVVLLTQQLVKQTPVVAAVAAEATPALAKPVGQVW
jgi:hypothetical protein